MPRLIVAMDGPAGTGKSTVSRVVSERAGLPHLDTGAFYRAATLAVLRAGVDPGDAEDVLKVVDSARFDQAGGTMLLDGEDVSSEIRGEKVTSAVSLVSSYPEVRQVLVRHQRAWISRHQGRGVVEGRDIGTVVFPEADVKIYLDASSEERARRRAEQAGLDPGAVQSDIERRDRFDSSRVASPLAIPEEAVVIDTTDMAFEDVVQRVLSLIAGAN